MKASGSMFRALRVRDFRLYFFGQLYSISGNNAQTVAVGWLILQLTGSGTMLGIVTASQYLPMLIVSPLLGSLIDRFPKRRILFVTQSLALAIASVLFVLAATGRVTAWQVCALTLTLGMVNAVDSPTRQALIRELVGHDLLSNAVALHNVLMGVARIAGPAAAGVIIALFGISTCFFFNALSFLFVLAALVAMSPQKQDVLTKDEAGERSLRSGFKYAASTPFVRMGLLLMAIVGTFTYEFWVTLPLLAKDVFEQGSSGYASIMTVMSVGSVVGGLFLARRREIGHRELVVATAAFGATTVAVGLTPTIEASFVPIALMGAAYSAFVSTSNATLQMNTDARFQGRVMALWTSAFMGSTAIGGPGMGWIAEHFGAPSALVLGGLVAIAAAGWVLQTSATEQNNACGDPETQVTERVAS